jgi:hypothetical protein
MLRRLRNLTVSSPSDQPLLDFLNKRPAADRDTPGPHVISLQIILCQYCFDLQPIPFQKRYPIRLAHRIDNLTGVIGSPLIILLMIRYPAWFPPIHFTFIVIAICAGKC